jgi:YggT family protein
MQGILITLINIIYQVLSILLIAYVVLSFFMAPYHPIRTFIDRIVEPLLAPIRRVVRPVGGLDLSPMIFLILLWILRAVLVSLIVSL